MKILATFRLSVFTFSVPFEMCQKVLKMFEPTNMWLQQSYDQSMLNIRLCQQSNSVFVDTLMHTNYIVFNDLSEDTLKLFSLSLRLETNKLDCFSLFQPSLIFEDKDIGHFQTFSIYFLSAFEKCLCCFYNDLSRDALKLFSLSLRLETNKLECLSLFQFQPSLIFVFKDISHYQTFSI